MLNQVLPLNIHWKIHFKIQSPVNYEFTGLG